MRPSNATDADPATPQAHIHESHIDEIQALEQVKVGSVCDKNSSGEWEAPNFSYLSPFVIFSHGVSANAFTVVTANVTILTYQQPKATP